MHEERAHKRARHRQHPEIVKSQGLSYRLKLFIRRKVEKNIVTMSLTYSLLIALGASIVYYVLRFFS